MLGMLKPSLIYFTVLLRGITCVECKANGWQQKGSFGLEILSQESSSSVSVPFFSSYLLPNMSSHRRISIAVMNTDFHSYSQSFMHLSFYLVLAFRSVRYHEILLFAITIALPIEFSLISPSVSTISP